MYIPFISSEPIRDYIILQVGTYAQGVTPSSDFAGVARRIHAGFSPQGIINMPRKFCREDPIYTREEALEICEFLMNSQDIMARDARWIPAQLHASFLNTTKTVRVAVREI